MLLAAAAALTGASVQSATGFGFALLLSPALFAVLDPYEAVTVMLALGLLLNVLVLADGDRRLIHARALVPMLVAAVPGLALGVLLLTWLSKPALQIGVGAAVLAAVAVQARMRQRRGALDDLPPGGAQLATGRSATAVPGHVVASPRHGLAGLLVGFTTGAMTTSVNVSGPPIMLWLEARGLPPAEIRASLAAAFLALNVGGGVAILASGDAHTVELAVIVPLIALVAVGHLLGRLVFRRLDAGAFATVALTLAAVAGAASVAAGAAAA